MSALPWIEDDANGLSIRVDLAIYSIDVVLRACHAFTARCYIFPRSIDRGSVVIDFAPRDEQASLRALTGELVNALLEEQLRALVAEETRAVRELLVAQAFCEADLLDRRDSEGGEYDDPRGIGRTVQR